MDSSGKEDEFSARFRVFLLQGYGVYSSKPCHVPISTRNTPYSILDSHDRSQNPQLEQTKDPNPQNPQITPKSSKFQTRKSLRKKQQNNNIRAQTPPPSSPGTLSGWCTNCSSRHLPSGKSGDFHFIGVVAAEGLGLRVWGLSKTTKFKKSLQREAYLSGHNLLKEKCRLWAKAVLCWAYPTIGGR